MHIHFKAPLWFGVFNDSFNNSSVTLTLVSFIDGGNRSARRNEGVITKLPNSENHQPVGSQTCIDR